MDDLQKGGVILVAGGILVFVIDLIAPSMLNSFFKRDVMIFAYLAVGGGTLLLISGFSSSEIIRGLVIGAIISVMALLFLTDDFYRSYSNGIFLVAMMAFAAILIFSFLGTENQGFIKIRMAILGSASIVAGLLMMFERYGNFVFRVGIAILLAGIAALVLVFFILLFNRKKKRREAASGNRWAPYLSNR